MKIDIVVRLELSPLQRRIVRGAIVAGAVIGALGLGVAVAAPHTFVHNEALSVATLQGLNVATSGTVQYSVGATKYCGETAQSTKGDLSGLPAGSTNAYRRAKASCEAANGCSPTAHVCTSEEVARSASLGIAMPTGWYQTASAAPVQTSPNELYDCRGWGSAVSTDFGSWWDANGGAPFPHIQGCDSPSQFLCCD